MKRALLKTAFNIIVIVLMIALLSLAYLLLDAAFPTGHGSLGLFPGIVVVAACLVVANRITSLLFWFVHGSDEHLSIFETRRSRRAG
jgi:hypothetical protein